MKPLAMVALGIVAVVVIASFVAIGYNIMDNKQSKKVDQLPFSTIEGNLSSPHPYYNSTYGFVSPNLWNLKQGKGEVNMSFYENSSVKTTASLYNVQPQLSVLGYPSEHFTYDMPMELKTMFEDNLSSYVSFSVGNATNYAPIDVAYDIFIGQGSTMQYEVMIWLYQNNGYITTFPFTNFTILTTVNGGLKAVNWEVYKMSDPSGWTIFMFVPELHFNKSMSYEINFPSFFSSLRNVVNISSTSTIVRLGIGSEFGSGLITSVNSLNYSFWLYSYFISDGVKYQIIQPSEVS